MNVSPLSREQGLVEDLMAAFELKPDILEIRSDQIPETYYEVIQTVAERIGCSLLLTLKQPVSLASIGVQGMLAKVSYVDLDISYVECMGLGSISRGKDENLKRDEVSSFIDLLKQSGARLIVSFHCYDVLSVREAKKYIDACLSQVLRFSESYAISVIPKIAVATDQIETGLSFMKYLRMCAIERLGAHNPWIGVPMGIASMSVRMMAASLGSLFTYAYLVKPNAPGQIPLYCLLEN